MASAKTKTGVEKAEKTTVLPGFTASETVILAAAFFHSRSADVSDNLIYDLTLHETSVLESGDILTNL